MRRWMMAVGAAAAVLVVPGGARAQCHFPGPCVCPTNYRSYRTLSLGEVTGTDGTTSTVEVLEVHGESEVLVPGDEVQITASAEQEVGDQVLLQDYGLLEPGALKWLPIEPNGVVICEDGFLVSAHKAIELGLSPETCWFESRDLGWESPPCNDTGACASGGAGAAPAWLVTLLLLTGAVIRRRRRATA